MRQRQDGQSWHRPMILQLQTFTTAPRRLGSHPAGWKKYLAGAHSREPNPQPNPRPVLLSARSGMSLLRATSTASQWALDPTQSGLLLCLHPLTSPREKGLHLQPAWTPPCCVGSEERAAAGEGLLSKKDAQGPFQGAVHSTKPPMILCIAFCTTDHS